MSDRITVALTDNGGFRIYSAITTDLVNEAQKIHKSYPVATAALGRVLTAGAIIRIFFPSPKAFTLSTTWSTLICSIGFPHLGQ